MTPDDGPGTKADTGTGAPRLLTPARQRAILTHVLPLLLFLFISVVMYRNLIFADGVIVNDDMGRQSDLDEFAHRHYYTWNEHDSSPDAPRPTQLLFYLPFLMAGKAMGLDTYQMLVLVFIFTEFMAALSMYYASRHVLGREYPRGGGYLVAVPLICAVAFMWSNYQLWHSMQPLIKAALAISPLIVLAILKGFESRKMRYIAMAGLLWSISCGDLHWAFYGGLLFVALILFRSAETMLALPMGCGRGRALAELGLCGAIMGVFLLSFSVFSAHWLLPGLYAGGSSRYGWLMTSDWLVKWYEGATIFEMIRTQSWQVNPSQFYSQGHGVLGSEAFTGLAFFLGLVAPLLAMFGLFMRRRSGSVAFFGLFLLAAVFFTCVVNFAPDLGVWIIMKAPLHEMYGWILRVAKTAALILVAVCFLMGFGLFELFAIVDKGKLRKGVKNCLCVSVLAMVLLSALLPAWPFATGDAGGSLTKVEVPREFVDADAYVGAQEGDFKVLYVPMYNNPDVVWNPGHRTIKDQPALDSSKPTYVFSTPNEEPNRFAIYYLQSLFSYYPDAFIPANRTNDLGKMLTPLGVRYLMLRDDVESMGKNAQGLRAVVGHQEDMRLVNVSGTVGVYENLDMQDRDLGHAYAPGSSYLVVGGLGVLPRLASVPQFDPMSTGLVFLDQRLEAEGYFSKMTRGVVMPRDVSLDELALHLSGKECFFSPFDQVPENDPSQKWSRIRMVDMGTKQVHDYADIGGWEWEMESGTVYTWARGKFDWNYKTMPQDQVLYLDFEGGYNGFWTTSRLLNMSLAPDPGGDTASLLGSLPQGEDPGLQAARSQLYSTGNWSSNVRVAMDLGLSEAYNTQFAMRFFDQDRQPIWRQYLFTRSGTQEAAEEEFDVHLPPGTRYCSMEVFSQENPIAPSSWSIGSIRISSLSGAYMPVRMEMSLDAPGDGDYEVFARTFFTPTGGAMAFTLNGLRCSLNTSSTMSALAWTRLGALHLDAGEHTLRMDNVEGFNAVNMVALVPSARMGALREEVQAYLDRSPLIYVLEAEDIRYGNTSIGLGLGSAASMARTLDIPGGASTEARLDILSSGNYSLALRCLIPDNDTRLCVRLGDLERTVMGAAGLAWYNISGKGLEKGQSTLALQAISERRAAGYTSFERGWDQTGTQSDSFSISGKRYSALVDHSSSTEGNASLRIGLDPAYEDGWCQVRTAEFNVTPGRQYIAGLDIRTANVRGLNVKAMGYNGSTGTWAKLDDVVAFVSGDKPWSDFERVLSIPTSVTRVQFVLTPGDVLYGPSGLGYAWFDNLTLTEGGRAGTVLVDQIVLYKADGGLTLEDLFSPPPGAQVLSYERADPTKMILRVRSDHPFMLCVRETFDEMWEAKVEGGGTGRTIPLFGMMTGIYIEDTGNLTITIRFKPQTLYVAGLVVLVCGSALALLMLAVSERKRALGVVSSLKGRGKDADGQPHRAPLRRMAEARKRPRG